MRFLISSILCVVACSNEPTSDRDPCARAVENARRLVETDETARERYGEQPLSAERCKEQPAAVAHCVAYASSWREVEACSSSVLRRTGVARE